MASVSMGDKKNSIPSASSNREIVSDKLLDLYEITVVEMSHKNLRIYVAT